MPLHPVAAQMIAASRESGRPNAHLLPVEQARINFENDYRALPKPDVAVVRDVEIPARDGTALPSRLFSNATEPESGAPLIVFFHGGGWLIGSIDTHDVMARKIALATGGVVLSVGYRLAPESRYPTATSDALDAVIWAVAHASELGADGARLVLAGDSAGGNLAAVTAIRCGDGEGPPVAHQLLVYPVTTCDLSIGFDMEWEGVMLYRDEMQWHQDLYLSDPSQRLDSFVAPLGAHLAGVAPATVVLAECDPIRPQGRLYADALLAAGVAVEVREYPSMVHGFFGVDDFAPEAQRAMQFAGESIRRSLRLAGESA